MTEEVQGEIAEIETVETPVEAVEVEPEIETVEAPEDKLSRLERELEEKTTKISRQQAALAKHNRDGRELRARLSELEKLKAAAPKQPTLDDFETTDEYINARAEFIAEQKLIQKEQQLIENQKRNLEAQTTQERDAAFRQAEHTFAANNPTYVQSKAEVADFVQVLQPNPHVVQAIYEQADTENNLPQIINYFGENNGAKLSELEKILQLSPIRAAVEISRIQEKLGGAQPKKATLPKPIKPVVGSAKSTKPLDKMSYEELKKAVFK